MNGIVPAPIASLPWRVIFILTALVGFGATIALNTQRWSGADAEVQPAFAARASGDELRRVKDSSR